MDLHTHSVDSPDGSLSVNDYRQMLKNKALDSIAVTDHNKIEMAVRLRKELGEGIIVGEEIMTQEGEIIGLYLNSVIPSMLTAKETVQLIHRQGGLVYIPHPFETVRKGITLETLEIIKDQVDIIEIHNGRAVLQNCSKQASEWAANNTIPAAASSDSHGPSGWGKTYSIVRTLPTRQNLTALLQDKDTTHRYAWPGMLGMAYPKLNRLRKRIRHV